MEVAGAVTIADFGALLEGWGDRRQGPPSSGLGAAHDGICEGNADGNVDHQSHTKSTADVRGASRPPVGNLVNWWLSLCNAG